MVANSGVDLQFINISDIEIEEEFTMHYTDLEFAKILQSSNLV